MSETIYWRMKEFPEQIWRKRDGWEHVEKYAGGGKWIDVPGIAEELDWRNHIERFKPDWKEVEQ